VTKKTAPRWTFAEDRRFIHFAKSLGTIEAIATKMNRPTLTIRRAATRLGFSLKSDGKQQAKK
jgi:hypothetical protein